MKIDSKKMGTKSIVDIKFEDKINTFSAKIANYGSNSRRVFEALLYEVLLSTMCSIYLLFRKNILYDGGLKLKSCHCSHFPGFPLLPNFIEKRKSIILTLLTILYFKIF